MEFWVALGIEQTKDEEAITAAYREKLQLVHPEEHPEEFMQLRAAYDEALKFARQTEDEAKPTELTPVDLWIQKVEQVYDDFALRTSVDEWKKLLEDEVCQGLDSRIDARNALLKFCMECFYMPNDVWQLIIDTFSIRENYDELCELFPKAYIDNAVILGADGVPVVPYGLFAEGTTGNPDAFIKLYYKARDERRSGNYDASAATIEDMKATGFEHPYITLAEAELAGVKGDGDRCAELSDQLTAKYPEDRGIRLHHGEAMRHIRKDYETALADYEFVLSEASENNQALWGKGECLLALERLEDAKDAFLALHQHIPYDEDVRARIDTINEKLSARYEQQILEQPDNFELRLDYAWSCLQRKEHDKAKALLADAVPSDIAERADLENLSTKLYLNCEEWEQSLAHATEWESIVKELPEGETEKEKKRKGKTGEILSLQAVSLYSLNRIDEALEKTFAAEAADPGSTEPVDLRRRIYNRRREFDKAVEAAEKVVQIEANYSNLFALAYEQYRQGDKVAAYHSFGEALEYARTLQGYMYRGRILCDFEEWDALKELISFLEENGIDKDSLSLRYLNARLEHGAGNKEEALKVYNELLELYESDTEEHGTDFIHEIYHHAADIEDDFERDPDEVLVKVEKGLALEEDHLPLLELKSYVLHRKKDHQGIIDHNLRTLEFYPRNQYAHVRIADAHYYLDNYAEAVEHYLQQEKIRDSAWVQEVLGICLMYLERYDEAEIHFRNATEIDPERIRPRANLGLMYERRWNAGKEAYDFDLSLPLQEECVRMNDELEEDKRNRVYRLWLARTLSRMGRYDEAMAVYHKNYELHGDEEDLRKEVELYMESGRFAEGEKLLDKYHKEGKLDDPYLIMKADFRRYQGKDKDFLKYMDKMEDGARKFIHLAHFYNDRFDLKKRRKAMELFRQALALAPDRVDAMDGYIRLLREAGRKADVEAMTKTAFEQVEEMRNHGWEVALYLTKMAMVHLAAGEPEKAKPYIDRAMTGPMCDHCRYRRCKDAYLAQMYYYLDKEMYEEAAQTCREAAEFVADEMDFRTIVKQLKKERKIK
ncbi:MAG: tetratricopeptide repeat protein [Ruminococcaceae bacterium]|nr:tetratricopeptide repeat protein [Oscillospiraceae bacterium]